MLAHLDGESEPGALLTHGLDLLVGLALHEVVELALIAELVDALEVQVKNEVDSEGDGQHANADGIANRELRGPLVGEEEGGGNARRVTEGKVHTGGEGALAVAGVIGGDPGEGDTGRDEDTDGDEEGACVGHSGALVGEKHSVSDHGDNDAAHDERAALLGLITVPGAEDVDNRTDEVDRDSQGLNLSSGPVADTLDNGGEEDDEGIQHSEHREEGETVSPGLPVLDAIDDILLNHVVKVVGFADLLVVDLLKNLPILLGEALGSVGAVG